MACCVQYELHVIKFPPRMYLETLYVYVWSKHCRRLQCFIFVWFGNVLNQVSHLQKRALL